MHRKYAVLGTLAVVMALSAPVAFAADAPPADAAKTQAAEPLPFAPVLGNPDAPVTIYEYSSLTCSHCAAFHRNVMPKIKEAYIDTGKAKLIIRDFPLDKLALYGSLMAHCASDNIYFPLVDLIYKQQAVWTSNPDPLKALSQMGALAGVSLDKTKSCWADEKMMDRVLATRQEGEDRYKIDGTPTFIFNNGEESIRGEASFEEFSAVIDKLLKK